VERKGEKNPSPRWLLALDTATARSGREDFYEAERRERERKRGGACVLCESGFETPAEVKSLKVPNIFNEAVICGEGRKGKRK